jgi:hypothetical protein
MKTKRTKCSTKRRPRGAIVVGLVAGIAAATAPTGCVDFDALDRCFGGACGDASSPDVAAPIDGGSAGVFHCADHPAALFCADFDGPTLEEGFEPSSDNGGATDPSLDRYLSPPRALRATVPSFELPKTPVAAFTRRLPAGVSFRAEWDTYITLEGDAENLDYGALSMADGATYLLSLRLRRTANNDADWLLEYGEPLAGGATLREFHNLSHAPVFDRWMHVEIRYTAGAPASATVFLEGVQSASTELKNTGYGQTPVLRVGIPATYGSGKAATVLVDNVLVEAL